MLSCSFFIFKYLLSLLVAVAFVVAISHYSRLHLRQPAFLRAIIKNIEHFHLQPKRHSQNMNQQMCDCVPEDGVRELKQLHRFWMNHEKNATADEKRTMTTEDLAFSIRNSYLYDMLSKNPNSYPKYSHSVGSVTMNSNTHGYGIASFVITERFGQESGHGGSTFKIIISGIRTRAVCSYDDQFDGQYLACCAVHERYSTIEVYLMNVKFLSYQVDESLHHLISSTEVVNRNPSVERDGSLVNARYPANAGQGDDCVFDDYYWLNSSKNGWEIVMNGHIFDPIYRRDAALCISKKYNGTMIVIGDQNVHLTFNYINMGLGSSDQGPNVDSDHIVHHPKAVSNYTYKRSSFISTFLTHLEEVHKEANAEIAILKKTKTTIPRRLLLLDTGIWDITYTTAASFMTQFMDVLSLVQRVKQQGMYEIIWQGMPPWPHDVGLDKGRKFNTYIIGAANAWAEHKLRQMDIPVIDYWRIALPFEDTKTDCELDHYLCRHKGEFQGHVGVAVAQLILRTACYK